MTEPGPVSGADGFGLALARASADTSVEEVLALLRRDGVVLIERALDERQLNAVRGELAPWFERAACGEGALFGRRTKRFAGLFAKAASTANLALHALVLEVMEAFLRGTQAKPACNGIQLNLTQAIAIGPGEPAQFLHRDEELWPFAHSGLEIMANAMWLLDDFTNDNGATRLIPQSHRWAREREPRPGEAAPACAPAGSVLLWTGGVLHGGGANASCAARRGVVMSYCVGWLAQTEKLLLSTPPAVARTLPERLQQLIGYQIHAPNLGWVEGRDPAEWLHGGFSDLAAPKDNLTPELEAILAQAQASPGDFAAYLT